MSPLYFLLHSICPVVSFPTYYLSCIWLLMIQHNLSIALLLDDMKEVSSLLLLPVHVISSRNSYQSFPLYFFLNSLYLYILLVSSLGFWVYSTLCFLPNKISVPRQRMRLMTTCILCDPCIYFAASILSQRRKTMKSC